MWMSTKLLKFHMALIINVIVFKNEKNDINKKCFITENIVLVNLTQKSCV